MSYLFCNQEWWYILNVRIIYGLGTLNLEQTCTGHIVYLLTAFGSLQVNVTGHSETFLKDVRAHFVI